MKLLSSMYEYMSGRGIRGRWTMYLLVLVAVGRLHTQASGERQIHIHARPLCLQPLLRGRIRI